MPCQLPADCLNEIFEYLEEDKATLHSCLLVNRLWCEATVRILWRNIWNFKCTDSTSSQILVPFITCLPNESKDLLHSNGIFISTPKFPSFNYASFCKILSIGKINIMIKVFLKNQQSIASRNLNDNDKSDDNQDLIAQEIFKMLMRETCSLKKLTYYSDDDDDIIISNNITFADFLLAKDSLAELSEFVCDSNLHFEFYYQLSQICRNIQSLNIHFKKTASDGLKYFISSQNGLKHLSLTHSNKGSAGWADIISSLTKHSNTLIKLEIDRLGYKSLPFISKFTNLQELNLSYVYTGLNELQFVTFPRLRVLKFQYGYPEVEKLIKFLETNGRNLEEFYVYTCSNSLNLAIAQFCPNLRSLFTIFEDKIETLKGIFNSCQRLESIEIWCGDWYLKEGEILEVVAKYSPENFHELKLHNYSVSELCSKDLESFLISWKSRVPQKSISFIFPNGRDSFANDNENKRVIEKYRKLGIIKKLVIL